MEAALLDGRIDLIPNFGITTERDSRLEFTRPVETSAIVQFVRAATPRRDGGDPLATRRVAVVRTNAAGRLVRAGGVEPVVYEDVSGALLDLLAGRVGVLVHPESVVWSLARAARVERRLRIEGEPLAEIERAVAVRLNETTLLARLSAAADELVQSSEYRELYSRWRGEEPPVWTTGRILVAMAIGLGLLALVVALARYRLLHRHAHELERRSEERDRAEAALAESEARYRLIVETSWEGIWTIDAQARTLFVNAPMAEMLGSSPEELVGRSAMDFVPEELIERAEALAGRRREGQVDLLDFRLKRPDGTTLEVMMTQSPILENGRYSGALTMVTDVSERRRLEEELRRSQAHEAQGRLAGFVAHDLNNLLAVINSASSS